MIEVVTFFPKNIDRPSEVNMNTMATIVVTLCRKDVAPALPKTV